MTNHERYIAECRQLLKPTEVRIGHVPSWLSKRIREKLTPRPTGPGWKLLQHAMQEANCRDAFDHFGSTTLSDGSAVFVSEPYLHPRQIIDAQRFADLLGLELIVSANSWWYPGSTVRLIFRAG